MQVDKTEAGSLAGQQRHPHDPAPVQRFDAVAEYGAMQECGITHQLPHVLSIRTQLFFERRHGVHAGMVPHDPFEHRSRHALDVNRPRCFGIPGVSMPVENGEIGIEAAQQRIQQCRGQRHRCIRQAGQQMQMRQPDRIGTGLSRARSRHQDGLCVHTFLRHS